MPDTNEGDKGGKPTPESLLEEAKRAIVDAGMSWERYTEIYDMVSPLVAGSSNKTIGVFGESLAQLNQASQITPEEAKAMRLSFFYQNLMTVAWTLDTLEGNRQSSPEAVTAAQNRLLDVMT